MLLVNNKGPSQNHLHLYSLERAFSSCVCKRTMNWLKRGQTISFQLNRSPFVLWREQSPEINFFYCFLALPRWVEHLRHLINGQYADRLSLFNLFGKNVRIVMSKGECYFLSLEISVAPFVAVRKELKLIGSLYNLAVYFLRLLCHP